MKKFNKYIPDGAKVELSANVVSFEVEIYNIEQVISDLHNVGKLPLKLITATVEQESQNQFRIWYVFGAPDCRMFIVPYIRLQNTQKFPSVTAIVHKALNFERKIKTFFGLTPIGHPDLRPIILHDNWPDDIYPLRKNVNGCIKPLCNNGNYKFQKLDGESVYEIPVGPIHAGIIEPGYFRFSVVGEEIMLLEPRLGFTHKGSEKLFETLAINDCIKLSEKISGDSSFSHSLCFCQALEMVSGIVPSRRAQFLRVIYAELERLANHFGDIGAIMVDTGFNFGGANGARLREIIMRLNERIGGNRFLRGINVVGGANKDISNEEKQFLQNELVNIAKDFDELIKITETSATLLNRLKGTGKLEQNIAKDFGILGVAARATGIRIDARLDFPYAAYDQLMHEKIEVLTNGDVLSRFLIRIKEVFAALRIIQATLDQLPAGEITEKAAKTILKKNSLAISIVEGWRGEIIYFVTTDSEGNINRVFPLDPSFVNWSVLPYAAVGNIVPDFPLINKSFNLSYSGNDL
ncbi:MAG: NADH-quinone oxidoreductase subunit C [Negativicutes bacterium]|jgi:Ni,Fe-hydrogenase III large subunit/Ni,Fe-hydrogenase III component G